MFGGLCDMAFLSFGCCACGSRVGDVVCISGGWVGLLWVCVLVI